MTDAANAPDPAPPIARHLPVTAAISIDRTMAATSAIVAFLSLAHVPDYFGWPVNTTTAVMGFVLMGLAAIRAWWEGRVLKQGGSVLDPAGAVAAGILGLLGVFGVPAALALTPAAVTGVVSSAFAAIASWRDYVRRRLARTSAS